MSNIYHIHYRLNTITLQWEEMSVKKETKTQEETFKIVDNEVWQGLKRPQISFDDMSLLSYDNKQVKTITAFIGSINQYITIYTEENDIMTEYDKIKSEYDIDAIGCVKSPGKFECEHWSIVSLYNRVMEGFTDNSFYWNDGSYSDFMIMSDNDKRVYGMPDNIYAVELRVSSDGFVYGYWFTKKQYDKQIAYYENEETEDEAY